MKKILFVCVQNSGRSQMAEAFFNRMARTTVTGISAGTQPGNNINPTVKEAMMELGIDMKGQKPKMLTPKLADQASHIITMGCGVEEGLCPATKIPAEDWGIEDPAGQPIEKVRQIRDEIKVKVERLIKELVETDNQKAISHACKGGC